MSIEATVYKGSASDGIIEAKTTFDAPTGTRVLVQVTHSGICGTDMHYEHADMVLGHEGVGVVKQIGPAVTTLAVGDVVGWGYINKTCGTCEWCLKGLDNVCRGQTEIYGFTNFHQGSFGSHAVWDESWLFKIPAGIAPEHAAPLMCGGATVFEIIDAYNIRPTDRVGVVGLGGLGHLAVQFLSKTGADVVVFSGTNQKREEALALGANEFYATKGVEKFENVKPLNHLIVTTNTLPDWKPFFEILQPKAIIYPLTVSFGDIIVPATPLMINGARIQGSPVASRSATRKMLEFAERHKVYPMIEKFKLDKNGVEAGMQKLREGHVRYRAVLVA
ncbi:hypothetical protein HMN09_00228300 [Mycena chlorophos]|uniref:Enoyl reductase (ER) domain-containing protein n=1 Tax=Mycena chlorophos TaxID=658473 RepID=A0A8H6TNJ1_MYCCL|nr:hypothetical protein HMN09_00228300 [Mycena chlorophos]